MKKIFAADERIYNTRAIENPINRNEQSRGDTWMHIKSYVDKINRQKQINK